MKKTLILVGTVLTVTLSGLGFTASTVEATPTVSENKEKINKVENKIIKSSKKVNKINLDIDILENAIQENDIEVKKVTKKVDAFETDIKKTEKEIDVLEKEIEKRNEILKERLTSYQNDGGDVGFMEVIFGSADFNEFISRYTAVTTITTADNKLVEAQKEAMVEVEAKQKEVEEKLIKTKETKVELEKVSKVKKDQKSDLNESKKEVEKEVAKLKDQKADYVAEGHNLAALEARIEAENAANDVTTDLVTQTSTESRSTQPIQLRSAALQSTPATESTSTQPTSTESESTTTSTQPTSTESESTTTSTQPTSTESESTTASTQPTSTESESTTTSTQPASTESQSTNDSPKKEKAKPKAEPKANLGSGSNGSALSAAHGQTGTRYTSAGKSPSTGFDCSGFVSWAYGQEGVSIPSYTGALASQGQAVPSLAQAKPGDLVFFRGGAHVGIYVGGGKFIGSQTSTGVAVADMNSGYWKDTFDGKIRRVK